MEVLYRHSFSTLFKRRVQVNQGDLKLNGTHRVLVYADDVNTLGRSVCTIEKNTQALVVARKEIGLEVNADNTKYMVMSQDQWAGRSHSVRIGNSSLQVWKSSNIWEQP